MSPARLASLTAVLLLALAGCTGSSPPPGPTTSEPPPPPSVATVPDVTGANRDLASQQIVSANLVALTQQKYSGAPDGTVIHQDPRAGSVVAVGSIVNLTVALPIPRIPSVNGKHRREAIRALKTARYRVRVNYFTTTTQPDDLVISQTPRGRTKAKPGRIVVLLVTNNPCTPGYSPCLIYHGGLDYDCIYGTGNGPFFTQPGVVYIVSGPDIYGLDGNDNDGRGCE